MVFLNHKARWQILHNGDSRKSRLHLAQSWRCCNQLGRWSASSRQLQYHQFGGAFTNFQRRHPLAKPCVCYFLSALLQISEAACSIISPCPESVHGCGYFIRHFIRGSSPFLVFLFVDNDHTHFIVRHHQGDHRQSRRLHGGIQVSSSWSLLSHFRI